MKIDSFNYNTLMFFLVRCCFAGMSINNLLVISRSDGWISIIFATILSVVPLYIFYYFNENYPGKTIFEVIEEYFDKNIGKIINYSLCGFVLFLAAITFWNLMNFVTSQFLYKTPTLPIALLFIGAIIYVNNKGIATLFRVSTILFYINIVLFLIIFLTLFSQIKLSLLFPPLRNGFMPIVKGSLHFMAYNILPLFMLLAIPKNKVDTNPTKNKIIMYLIAVFSLFGMLFVVLSIYGIDIAILLQYPEFHILKRLSLMGIIERVENILSIQWAFDFFIFLSFCVYFINCYTKINNYIIGVVIMFLSFYIFKNYSSGNLFILNVLPYLCFLFFLGTPLYLIIKKQKNK
ncbi:MAG: GerAB/ArcD/ProY family transporter [Bacilli bacterium]